MGRTDQLRWLYDILYVRNSGLFPRSTYGFSSIWTVGTGSAGVQYLGRYRIIAVGKVAGLSDVARGRTPAAHPCYGLEWANGPTKKNDWIWPDFIFVRGVRYPDTSPPLDCLGSV